MNTLPPSTLALANMRVSYETATLLESDITPNPMTLFESWFNNARDVEKLKEPNAVCLGTCNKETGKPSSRMVLVKHFDDNGFMFFTNYNSRKSKEIKDNPNACMTFWWDQRQVRIEGIVSKVSDSVNDAYFKERPLNSQIGAWASEYQSGTVKSREELESAQDNYSKKFEKEEMKRPSFWGGFNLFPERIEFWQGRRGRLHDRLLYTRNGNSWSVERLSP